MKFKKRISKVMDTARYKFLAFGLRTFARMFSERYVDQFETYRVKSKYSIFVRFDRSLPNDQMKYVIDL